MKLYTAISVQCTTDAIMTSSTIFSYSDAEIFNKPMALFLGPWSAGKSSVINYLLGTEHTKAGLKTGTHFKHRSVHKQKCMEWSRAPVQRVFPDTAGPQPTDIDFTIVHYADKLQRASGTEMAAHWAFSSVNKFGQGFLDHFRGIGLPHPLLQKASRCRAQRPNFAW